MTSRVRKLAALAVVALSLAACGGPPASLKESVAARQALRSKVAAIRLDAANHNPQAAALGLAALQQAVVRYENEGQLSAAQASRIRSAIAQVRTDLVLLVTTTTTSSTTTTQPATTTSPPTTVKSHPKKPHPGPPGPPPGHGGHGHGDGPGGQDN
jgi:hypothetical protein